MLRGIGLGLRSRVAALPLAPCFRVVLFTLQNHLSARGCDTVAMRMTIFCVCSRRTGANWELGHTGSYSVCFTLAERGFQQNLMRLSGLEEVASHRSRDVGPRINLQQLA